MATLTITIPAGVAARVNDAIADKYGYQSTINGEANPESKANFNQRMIRGYIKGLVKEYEVKVAANTAANTAEAAVETDITLS